MLDRQRLAHHARGCALLFATAFVVLSLASFDPADPPGMAASPPNVPASNLCGPVGATLASFLLESIGLASWLLAWSMLVANLLVLRRRVVPEIGMRLVGASLLVLATATIAQQFAGSVQFCPIIGAGGYLGAVSVGLLKGQLGLAGLMLVLVGVGATGLALASDVLFVWPVLELIQVFRTNHRLRINDPLSIDSPVLLPGPRYADEIDTPRPALAVDRPALFRPTGPLQVNTPATQSLRNHLPSPTSLPASSVPAPANSTFALPPLNLLEASPEFPVHEHEAMIQARALILERTLLEFGYQVRVVQIDTGPVITQFEIELEAGLRVARIVSLADDLAIALAVPSVRIVAPIPGKTTVGIEVPNERRGMVKLLDVVNGTATQLDKLKIPLFLGKDVKGMPLVFDLADMPHLLIAGRTGTGKSVCLNAMILSILMTKRPDEVKLILIDPKMVELSQFKRIPHLMHPVVTDMKKAESLLSWACDKMDERYGYLARAGVRNIQTYNALGAEEILNRLNPESDEERARIPTYMSYIVIIADEMADLMMTAAKEVESHIVRLAQKARAVGMHLIVATQKPTVDVITGLIKGNLPARIAFQVASRGDSRVVLDEMGADKLLGNGDMLFLVPGTSHIVRAQGTYVSDAEVNRVTAHLGQYPVEFSRELVQLQVGGGPGGKERGDALKQRDDLYEPAIEVVIREGRGSCSLLQRALGIGYGRAARLIDFMAEDGIVGEFKSGSAREVLYSWEEWESLKNGSDSAGNAA